MILTKTYGLKSGLARAELDLSVGGAADLEYRFTTDAQPSWANMLIAGFWNSVIADTFISKAAIVTASAINFGTGKYEIALADSELTASGGDNVFRYTWLVELNSLKTLCYWDAGGPIQVLDGQTLELRLNDANDIAFDIG